MKIVIAIHSTASDGVHTPAEILQTGEINWVPLITDVVVADKEILGMGEFPAEWLSWSEISAQSLTVSLPGVFISGIQWMWMILLQIKLWKSLRKPEETATPGIRNL
ncbi:MAG: hypothetical protein R2941_03040 [Desulfobacterales bacterium]